MAPWDGHDYNKLKCNNKMLEVELLMLNVNASIVCKHQLRMYGLTLLPHMQFSPKDGVRMLRWLAMQCNSSFKLDLACEKGSLKWLACQQICPDLLQDKKLSPLGTVIFCILPLDLPSNRKTGIHLQPSQKNTLQILQTWSSWFFKRESFMYHHLQVYQRFMTTIFLWGKKITSMGLFFNSV